MNKINQNIMSSKSSDINLPTIDLSFLTEDERRKIAAVLNRDESLRKKQAEKNMKLKQEIDMIEAKSLDIPASLISTAANCVRCRQAFGFSFFSYGGEFCPQCTFKVCSRCKVNQVENGILPKNRTDKALWLCILCHKYNEWMIQTGNWVQLQENTNNFSDVSLERTPTTTRSPSPTNSSSSSTISKSTLTGSRLIKLSLFPENQSQILEELEKEKKSLFKRYSSVKKARSHHSLAGAQQILHSAEPQHQAESYDDVFESLNTNANLHSGSITPTFSSTSRSSSVNRATSADTSVHSPNNSLHKDQTTFFKSNNGPTSTISDNNNKNNFNKTDAKPVLNPTPIIDPNSSINSTTPKAFSSMFKFWTTTTSGNYNDTTTKAIENSGTSNNDTAIMASSPTTKSAKSLTFNEKVTQMPTTKSTPNIISKANFTNTLVESNLNRIMLPKTDEINDHDNDDLASVTSSEFDKSSSIGGISLSRFRERSSIEVTPNASISSRTLNNANSIKDDLSQILNERKHLYKKKEKSKSPISMLPSTQHDNNDSDTDMVDMDHIFAKEKARQSIKQTKKEASPPLANNSMSTQALDRQTNIIDNYSSINRNGGMGKSFTSEQNVNRSRATSSPAHHNLNGGDSFGKEETNEYERKYLRQEKEKNGTNKTAYFGGGGETSTNFSNKEKGSMPFLSSLKRHAKSRASLSSLFRASSNKSLNKSIDEDGDYSNEMDPNNKGKIYLKLAYEKKSSNLAITIIKCENLVNLKKESCNSYVKVYLKPGIKDKNNKRKTLIKKNNCNPEFNETFRYVLPFNKITEHQLWVSVWHKETFDRNKFLGEINIPLTDSNVNNTNLSYDLERKVNIVRV